MMLESCGWNPRVATAFAALDDPTLVPARVAREDRDRYTLLTAEGERSAVLAGRLRHEARSALELPAVGDWVAARAGDGSDAASELVVVALLPRAGAFVRARSGDATVEQVVAANVDTVFVMSGLDGDFNPRRIERYLAAAWEGGANPVVVLNKVDLAADLGSRIAEVESVALGVPVVAIGALEGVGLDALDPWLVSGHTVALLGSSGVGKSTLVNALLGEERQLTREVREDDSRGRHTTTWRELIPLPGGAVLLDTPGMRTLALWGGEEGLAEAFADIASLAAGCRFGDCSHESEPGCAVLAAVADGTLDEARLASWHKLQKELRWQERRLDPIARAAEEARWKAIHKSMKHHPKTRRWE
jgi:ribosome biogenesis GTPase / thiamine phosphate phosphatase